MRSAPVIVVGAGAAGLGAAVEVATSAPTILVDRIPVPGGAAGWDRDDVRGLTAVARRRRVAFMLGTTATRWASGRLLVCGPDRIAWHEASALLFAGGHRPSTPGELGVIGDRPAGVLPVTVAKHLLEASGRLWRRPVVVGDGFGSGDCAALVAAGGGIVTAVGEAPLSCPWADARWPGWRATRVFGDAHVGGVRIERGGESRDLECDALLLAADPRPVRNVEGAIGDGADGVIYVQPGLSTGFAATAQAGAEIARAFLRAAWRAAS